MQLQHILQKLVNVLRLPSARKPRHEILGGVHLINDQGDLNRSPISSLGVGAVEAHAGAAEGGAPRPMAALQPYEEAEGDAGRWRPGCGGDCGC